MEETKLFEDTKKTLRKHVREIRKTVSPVLSATCFTVFLFQSDAAKAAYQNIHLACL